MKVILIVFALALSIGCQADSQPVKVQDAGVKDAQPQKKDASGTNYTDDPDFVGC